jgi:hypothetical protein
VSITSSLRTGAGLGTPARVRKALRAGTVAALTSAPLVAANAAFATTDGPLSPLQTIGIFVCIPVGLFTVITCLVLAPGWLKGDSHRREVGWSGEAAQAARTADVAKAADVARDGAKDGATAGAEEGSAKTVSSIQDLTDEGAPGAKAAANTGGASGTWQN